MLKALRVILVLVLVGVAVSPMFLGPGIAESYGLDRADGSSLGLLVSLPMLLIIGWVSLRILRRQARHEVGQEVNRVLYPYRDEEDKGKP